MAGEIVLGFDGSGGSKAAMEQAIAMARAFGTSVIVAYGYATNPVGGENKDQEAVVRELGQTIAQEAVEHIAAAGVEVAVELIHDRPAEGIMDVAVARGARVIVVGSRGESPLTGAILGSVTYKLVHRSPIPVLVVPPGD
jgi:nucleotide-binding universal stress UspA family protein